MRGNRNTEKACAEYSEFLAEGMKSYTVERNAMILYEIGRDDTVS